MKGFWAFCFSLLCCADYSFASPVNIVETERYFYVQGGNERGQLVGFYGGDAAVYEAGRVNLIPMDQPLSINSFGVVVGVSNNLPAAFSSGTVFLLDFPIDSLPADSPRNVVGPQRFNYKQYYSGGAVSVSDDGIISGWVSRFLTYTESCYYPNNPAAACGSGWGVTESSFKNYLWDVSGLNDHQPIFLGETPSVVPGLPRHPYISGDFDGYLSGMDRLAGWRTGALSYMSPSGMGYGSAYNEFSKTNGFFSIPLSAIPEPSARWILLSGLFFLLLTFHQAARSTEG